MTTSMVTIVLFLIILSTILIYSLMVSDVEEKTYTFGMLRALGFKNTNLKMLITIQSFTFSIPGLLIGLIVAALLNVVVAYGIYIFSQNASTYKLSLSAVILGIVLGLVLPLVSNILPIQQAMSLNLRDTLDLYHRTINELTVKIKRLEEMGLSVTQIVVGCMLVFWGSIVYFFAPMSYIYGDYVMFFTIINLLLIIMIIGLVFISILLLPYMELVFVYMFTHLVCRKDRKLNDIVQKNMKGHDKRNTKTAIMLTIAFSFLIFAASSFMLISHILVSQIESFIGASVFVTTLDDDDFLREMELAQFLIEQYEYDEAVVGYSFASVQLDELLGQLSGADWETYFASACGFN